MSVVVGESSTGSVHIPVGVATDRRLSFRARGVLLYLLAQGEGTRVASAEIADATDGEGRNAVRGALQELTERGYYRVTRVRGDAGRFVMLAEVSPVPRPEWTAGEGVAR